MFRAMKPDAIILVGGKGTRLASVVSDVAKPMAQVEGRPFVDHLVERLKVQGIGRIVMAAGHKALSVLDFYKDKQDVICVKETEALGTGGALLNALAALPDLSDPFFVLNGDSFYPFELSDFNETSGGEVLMGAVEVEDSGRYGTLKLDSQNRVIDFCEKTGKAEKGLVNAGVYRFRKRVLGGLKQGPMSLEKDLFPSLAAKGALIAVPSKGPMLDIGLPETYEAAPDFFRMLGE